MNFSNFRENATLSQCHYLRRYRQSISSCLPHCFQWFLHAEILLDWRTLPRQTAGNRWLILSCHPSPACLSLIREPVTGYLGFGSISWIRTNAPANLEITRRFQVCSLTASCFTVSLRTIQLHKLLILLIWCNRFDLNERPLDFQTSALTSLSYSCEIHACSFESRSPPRSLGLCSTSRCSDVWWNLGDYVLLPSQTGIPRYPWCLTD